MEGANRWDDTSETSVSSKPSPACPKLKLTTCCQSSAQSPQNSSSKSPQQGSPQELAHANRAVVPKANCRPGSTHGCSSSLPTRRLPLVLGEDPSLLGCGPRRTQTSIRGLLSCTRRSDISRGCRIEHSQRLMSENPPCTVQTACVLRPLNAPSVVRQMRRNTVSLRVEKTSACAEKHGPVSS